MIPDYYIQPQIWMTAPETSKLINALSSSGKDKKIALFVGGCVRDSLLGRPVNDIDIATILHPDEVSRSLNKVGIKVYETGLEHGTVTAISDGKSFQITTLRRDNNTDGRRAQVSFTDQWVIDAKRRDFTVNAIYADICGNVYDPVGGIEDIKMRRVRFVGDAQKRIKEDILRLLRFFRFYAQFSTPPPDRQALEACRQLAYKIPNLSGERIKVETFKLLETDDPATTLSLMSANGVLKYFLPEVKQIDRLSGLVIAENIVGSIDPLRRLAAAVKTDIDGALVVARRLRFSNMAAKRLGRLVVKDQRIKRDMNIELSMKLIYLLGIDLWRDRVLINWADDIALGQNQEGVFNEQWQSIYRIADKWKRPIFPLKGTDVLDLGIVSGPSIGSYLNNVEEWWIENYFLPNKCKCLSKLKDFIRSD